MSSTSRPPRLLYLAFAFGTATIGLAVLSFWDWEETSSLVERVYAAVGLLLLNPPSNPPTDVWLTFARVGTLFFWLTTVFGVWIELSPDVRDRFLMAKNWWRRVVLRRPQALVIGLGWVGGPLAAEIGNEKKNPVVGIALNEESTRVAEARKAGVLVLLGDANDYDVRRRAGLRHADEVFIATGDDGRNLDLAGDILKDVEEKRIRSCSADDPLECHIHVGTPAFRETIKRHDLLGAVDGVTGLEFHTFSALELAAVQLFLQPEGRLARFCTPEEQGEESRRDVEFRDNLKTFPEKADEVFHLFVIGFGQVGQAIALTAARLAHFPNGLRSRLTIIGEAEPGRLRWEKFLARHPAFSPPHLDLSSEPFYQAGDTWWGRPGRPEDASRRFRPWVRVDKRKKNVAAAHERDASRVRPIEYAVNAEFVSMSPEHDTEALVQAFVARLRPERKPHVRAACVLAFDEERRSYQAAVQLQAALAPYACEKTAPDQRPIKMPICVYLPVEKGLEELLAKRPVQEADKESADNLPLRAFGQRRKVASYERIVGKSMRERAHQVASTHRAISGRTDSHPDFADSNTFAARHTEIKLDALRIVFRPSMRPSGEPPCDNPLLWKLMEPDVLEEHRVLEEEAARRVRHSRDTGQADDGMLALCDRAYRSLTPELRQRLELLERLRECEVPERIDDETPSQRARREKAKREATFRRQCLCDAITRFEKEIGTDQATLAATMEHNRWLGERLAAGWRFGSGCNLRRQRVSFVPWEDLDWEERLYDRAHLPRLILEQGPQWSDPRPFAEGPREGRFYAYVTHGSFCKASARRGKLGGGVRGHSW